MSGFRRTISHWTAGTGRASALDKEHYHFITEFDGNVVAGKMTPEDNIVTSDGVYAAHTLHLNTGSIGCAMAGMAGAKEEPFDPGPYPLNEKQFRAHCRKLAQLHAEYNIPVTPTTCLTHAEVEPVLGVKQRGKWDIARLPWAPEIRGPIPVGNLMRSLVQEYMGAQPAIPPSGRGILKRGDRGELVKELQLSLIAIGYPLGTADGIFGSLTEQAVMAFQSENGLVKDGWVGDQTWNALKTAKPRELAESRKEITSKELLERGSRTIKGAKGVKSAAEAGGGLAVAAVAVNQMEEVSTLLTKADGAIGTIKAVALTYWPVILIVIVLFMVWRRADSAEKARVEDARAGRNIGR